MYNFMGCSQMMFGPLVRYGVTYKANEPDFTIYARKYFHNFKVAITAQNYEGALGGDLGKSQEYLLAEKTKLCIYDNQTFTLKYSIDVPKNENKDEHSHPEEILYVTVSNSQKKIGVALGRYILKDIKEICRLAFFTRASKETEFQLEKILKFEFIDACIQFTFSKKND